MMKYLEGEEYEAEFGLTDSEKEFFEMYKGIDDLVNIRRELEDLELRELYEGRGDMLQDVFVEKIYEDEE